MIIANTTKGKCVSFMENDANWHGAAPNDEQYAQGVSDIDEIIKSLGGAC
jgi:transketolase